MPFTKRVTVGRPLSYDEVDANWAELERIYDETLAARDIAVADTIIYPDETAGIAATAEGGYFVVLDTGTDELVFVRKVAGAPVEQLRIGARLPYGGGTLVTALNHAPAVTLASTTTTNIGAAAANAITITGTTTIAAFDTIADGAVRVLTFAAALTLTHNATSLILPGGANITTAAGDVAIFLSLGAGNWRCIAYQRASGKAVINIPHTWSVSGEIKVPVGQTDVLPGFFVPPALAPGQTARLLSVRHVIGAGTSVTVKLQKGGVDITGFTGISVTPTPGTTTPTPVSLGAGDYIQPVVTAVSGTPTNMTLTISVEYTAEAL